MPLSVHFVSYSVSGYVTRCAGMGGRHDYLCTMFQRLGRLALSLHEIIGRSYPKRIAYT